MDKKSIIDMAQGAVVERIDYEMSRMIDNIIDPNTDPKKKRTLTIKIDITPDAERQNLRTDISVSAKLQPTNPIPVPLYLTTDTNGEITAIEMTPQIPGQMDMFGGEQTQPSEIRLIRDKIG